MIRCNPSHIQSLPPDHKFPPDAHRLKTHTQQDKNDAVLSAALQRAQQEATLANSLLSATLNLRQDGFRHWLSIPLPDFTQPQSNLCWNLEVAKRGFDLTRISGWAYVDDAEAVRHGVHGLLAIGPGAAWVLPGITVERPDVLSVFPATGRAAINRLHSGFVFETSSSQLPDNVKAWRILLGSTNRPPAMSPEFLLA